ncbi:MAG: DoxX family protein, partial [Solirubrobacteraceae bacterium]|nr:DoxX family protein [Solirubrobacteraceae bacterium]
MDVILVIGRVLFAAIFIASGIAHFRQADAMAGYAAHKGAPGGKAGVLFSGVVFLLGGLSIALGIYPDLGALVIAAALIPVSYFMHAFWKETDPMAAQAENASFMKNVALIGAALVFFAVFQQYGVDAGVISDPL